MKSTISDALAELRRQFADQLLARLETIQTHYRQLDPAQWRAADLEVLHRLVHGLTGSAGTFGMQSVSDAARALEVRLQGLLKTGRVPDAQAWRDVADALGHLQELAHIRLESNAPSLKPPAAAQRLERSPLIYLVEDDVEQAEHLRQALQEDGYRVRAFSELKDFRAACAIADAEHPAAILMDMIFPEGDDAGAKLLGEIGAGGSQCPPVIFVSVRDDLQSRLAAFRAGACRYLVKPVDPERVIDLLDGLTGRQPPQPYRVLMVDDDSLLLEAQAAVLRATGMEVMTLSQPLDFMQAVDQFSPDVVVLDVYMPQASGPELAAVLRERDEYLHLPILFLSAESDMSQQMLALNLGGDDFLVKPVQAEHLVAAVAARARRMRQNNAIRKRLETTLYEREREHLALDQHAIVSIADQTGAITYVNDKFCKISGYARSELLGQNHRLIKSGEHPPEFYQALWRSIASGEVWQGEICNRRKDGSLYWVASTITPFLDGLGKPYQYVSIRTDITHVKQAEAALRESESRLNQAQNVAHLGSFEWNLITGKLTWSDEHFRLWGLAPGSVEPSFELFRQGIAAEDLKRLDAALQHAKDTQEAFECVYRFTPPNDAERVMHSLGEFVFDADGVAIKLNGTVQDVTERIRIEQAAEADKERLRRGQQFANIGTWDWNIQTGDLFWTERIAPLFGYAVAELETSYENFLAAIHPDDRQAVIDAVNASVEHNAPYEIEHRVVWPDGTVRWLLERGAVLRDAEGKPLQMLGVVQDIDDRKRTEMALAERERQLREAQTLARIGNWQADLTTGSLIWSDEIYRIFGRTRDGFVPTVEVFVAAIHPDDVAKVKESERRAEQTGSHDVVHRILRPDGTVRHVHELARAEMDGTGRVVRLSGTVQDITERVEAEARLHETEHRFAFAVEGAGDGVWDWDIFSGRMDLSGQYEAMLGYQKGELAPTIDAWIDSVHPDDLKRIQRKLQAFLDGKEPAYVVELRLRCKKGSYKWILCRGTVINRDRDGKPRRMIGIHSDITERKHDEQALIAAREDADRANRAKSEFLSSMSHELRTPMNAILGFSQLMEYDAALSEEHHDNVQEILKAGRHLLNLINEVLDLAKVESGHIDLSLEQLALCPIVQECLSLVRTLAEKRDIQISHAGFKDAWVRADSTRLKQVLLNLLSNAIKYNRDGGSVKLDIKNQGGGYLRICITDTGAGIPADRMQELFKPFNRLGAEASEIEGTGIGLTITQRIVEMMGGTVGVESEFGNGSTFWIELPLESAEQEVNAGMAGALETPAMPAVTSATQHLVLYIEDNPSNIKLVSQMLGRRPHIHLITAHTSELGIELAMARRPELILLDINMPGMNGYQVLEVFKGEPCLKSIPVVAITANALPRDIERGKAAGFVEYLTKPLNVTMFHRAIDRLLNVEQP